MSLAEKKSQRNFSI